MRFIAALVLLVSLALGLPACKTVTSPPVTNVAADCAAPAIRDVAVHLLDDVSSALVVTGDWRQALMNVAIRAGTNGLAAVKCAVAEVFGSTDRQLEARASMDPATAERTQEMHNRAQIWLAENP